MENTKAKVGLWLSFVSLLLVMFFFATIVVYIIFKGDSPSWVSWFLNLYVYPALLPMVTSSVAMVVGTKTRSTFSKTTLKLGWIGLLGTALYIISYHIMLIFFFIKNLPTAGF